MGLELVTFGGLHAVDDTGELARLLGQHSRAALFIYLAVERRVPRDSLMAIFWPESDAENARHALRQSLYHLRKVTGGSWIESRAHELVVSENVQVDADAFTRAVERGDLEEAVRLYRGPFLDGVHLVDLAPWEGWVDARRAQYARAFRAVARELIDAKRSAGDFPAALTVAEQWTQRDPTDHEAQHRLIETLAAAGEHTEAIRQYETFARTLEQDELSPPDETRDLIERLRAESLPLPPVRGAPPSAAPSAAPDATPANRASVRTRPALAALLLALVAISAWALRRDGESRDALAPGRIAVLPFAVRGADDVRYLRAGMVSLLSAALDGAGTVRPADTRATFAALGTDTVADLENGARVAARLGASMFVLGDIVEAGGSVRMDAAVYRLGREREVVQPTARATVSGAADSVLALVDRLAAQLLAELGDPAADRLVRTASLTGSLAAFKRFLEGEQLMRAGELERAADAYLEATLLDSAFALAHYRLAIARQWAPLPGEAEAAANAARHVDRLSVRDRARLDAFREWRAGDAMRAAASYRAIVARYPEDVDAWMQLGEIQFHYYPLLGHPLSESEEAFRQVLAREPRNLFAVTHLGRIAAASGRGATVDSLLAPFTPDELRRDRRVVEIVWLRSLAAGDTAASRAIVAALQSWEPFASWRLAAWVTAFAPDPELTALTIREMAASHPSGGTRADLYWLASILHLAAGRVSASDSARADAVRAEREVPRARRRVGFELVTEWYAATLPLPFPDSLLERVRRRAAAASVPAGSGFATQLGTETSLRLEPLRRYTLGVLALRLGDPADAADAARELHRLASLPDATGLVRDLDRGLRARLAAHEGRVDEALRLLESLEHGEPQGDFGIIPFLSRASERFLHAELLTSAGREADALRWLASIGVGSVTEVPLRALAHYRSAEIHARLGRSAEAARHGAVAAELWRHSDPELRASLTFVPMVSTVAALRPLSLHLP